MTYKKGKIKLQLQDNQRKIIVVATPNISAKDWQFLQTTRKKYDTKAHAFIGPHFTLFSGIGCFSTENFSKTIRNNIKQQAKISFCIRTAIFMPPLNNYKSWYVFLVPDQGFSELSNLHRQMHSGKIHNMVDEDFPFIPHMNIGSFTNKFDCLQVVNQLNTVELNLHGYVEKIQLIEAVNNTAQVFDEILLE